MFVFSGGGLHVYWCMTEAIPQARWQPLAQALQRICQLHHLKFDASVTIDAARILRPPESFNYKTGQPRPVTMQMLGPVYTEDQLQQALQPHGALRVVQTAHEPSATNAAFMSGLDDAGAGPVDLESLADAGCGVIKEALDTGGRTHSEPLWNLLMLAASFDTDPDEIAHWLGENHPGYTPEDTEKKLEEKRRARAQNPNIGWPTCSSFSTVSSICQTCPHFAAGKTPFHLRPRAGPNPVLPTATGTPLPQGYYRTANNYVWTTIATKTGTIDVPVLDYPILDAYLRTDVYGLVMKMTINASDEFIEVPCTSMPTWQSVAAAISPFGLAFTNKQRDLFREFVVAWLHKLQQMQNLPRIRAASAGWEGETFVFANHAYGPAGAVEEVFVDPKIHAPGYSTKGVLQPWKEAAKMITDQGSPELDMLLATSFAAALIELTGQSGAIVSAFSPSSGCGKSTAIKVGQGVWGHPRKGVNMLADTDNAVFAKLAAIRNLPLYWDELHVEEDIIKFSQILFRITHGREKARLDRNATMRQTNEFSSLIIACSNSSLADKLALRGKNTSAGTLRCFEFQMPDLKSKLSPSVVDAMVDRLRENHGVAGVEYARVISENKDKTKAMVMAARQHFETKLTLNTSERFLAIVAATTFVGAMLANHAKLTEFNLTKLEQFLCDAILRQRRERTESIMDTRTNDGAGDLVSKLLHEGRNKFLIISDHVVTPGYNYNPINNLHGSHDRVQAPWAQFGTTDNRLRVLQREFKSWLLANGYSPSSVVEALSKQFAQGPVSTRSTIGAGTTLFGSLVNAGRPRTFDFVIPSPSASSGSPAQSTP